VISYKYLILIGLFFLVWAFLSWKGMNPFAWFGKLPGDIRFQSNRTEVFIPLTSMLIISIVLSLIGYFFQRW
jgi:hypothetical protein